MIKRWHSSSRITSSAAGGRGGASFHGDEVPAGLHAVYVGKSRRRYLVSSDLVDHPLFRVLVARTGGSVVGSTGAGTVVGCEVVLFDHLLWMLENADPPPDSLDELVDFYSC
ncbi:Auxin-responsive SAUR protein family member [Musa troglodytarum]|uniref:Auxin-responsive SAUR protein family member n=1 Tax=Musa troglodytarum TaxID=320322 RepID=A0A9E7HD53_9LILI|nr:Auxin-responsive SAUR protein family member [Musa troglodytarum]